VRARRSHGDALAANAAATAALALELTPAFELSEVVVPAASGGGADGPSVVNVAGGPDGPSAGLPLALPPHCRVVGRAVRFVCFDVAGAPPSASLRSWICAQSDALWLDVEHAFPAAASTAAPSPPVRRLPSTQRELSRVLTTLTQLLLQEQVAEAFTLARAYTPPLPAAGAELALCVTRAAARLCATAGRASVWPALRAELLAIDAAAAARARDSADATAPTSLGGNLGAYAHYIAAAEAALAQDSDVALPQVSVLLCTVTFYANHAHNLTRSP
jgi:hypothetical protein